MMHIKKMMMGYLWVVAMGVGMLLPGCSSTGRTTETPTAGVRGQVVQAALSEIGTSYQYGAQSPGKALDCSALTQYAYDAAGVAIPRISVDQHKFATPVRLAKVQPGDLVFFKIRPGLSHVGLIVDGKRFVHASTSRHRVALSSLDSDYWQQRCVGAGTYLR
jgi:cell wall-associated NlpC family hydrolase